jgi:hypothetical protein
MRLKEVANFGPKLTTFRPQDRTMVQKDAFKRSREFLSPKPTTFRPQDRTMVQKDAFKRSREFWPKTDNF